jgi:serine/threonine protein kinase/TolB-like protein/Tfp pilus assembly protein PilF
MNPARFQTIEEIYCAALDQEPGQIGAFLDTACEGDKPLRRKVEALLSSRQEARSFIETSAVGIAAKIIQDGQADLLVGQTIGHYKISSRIGSGGMGEVYLAIDITAGRKAALKLLPARFTGDAERLKRFQQEARAVVGLNHPNILTVYEIGEDQSTYYIASELIEGETLRQRLRRGGMALSEAIDVVIQVVSALAAAHEAGIIHRDIKPENIMLRPDGYVKVLDFGIAKLAEQEVPVAIPTDEALLLVETNLGSILGTVRYMSPEQARGAPVDQGTDIWSLGVVLYEMVTEHAPFTGETPGEAMHSILETEPPPLTRYVTQIPAELQHIIGKTLRKDRAERYQSAHALLEALQSLRRRIEFKAELERSHGSLGRTDMSGEVKKEIQLEIAHVLFIDIVGYSKLSMDDQHAAIEELNQVVGASEQFQRAEAVGRLIKIPTGDGIALVFYISPEAPVQCAVEISRALKGHPRLQLRMGIHSGPVSGVVDVNKRANLAGTGLNIAQRVMDCGDAGHILLSKHVAEDLGEYEKWRPRLHDLGLFEAKHGVRVSVVNLYDDQFGNAKLPRKFETLQKRLTRLRWAAMTAALLALVAIVVGIVMVSRNRVTATLAAPEKSIAVLPFENRSEDKANAYFADGIQDEILTRLSKIADLKVISRTSTQHYKSAPENLPEIARQLGVAHILEGSVQKSGDAVRVTVQLIRAANDSHLWADSFDRKLTDIFSVESEVAKAIADQLRVKLTGREEQEITAKPTGNPEAYDAYLRGLAYSLKAQNSPANSLGAQKHLREAVRLDPKFALAWALLSYIDSFGYIGITLQATESLREEARQGADTALTLQPNLGEGLIAKGYYYYAYLKDYPSAVRYFEQARPLLPNSSRIPECLAYVARRGGQWELSESFFNQAERLDPRNVTQLSQHALSYVLLRRFPQAIRKLDQVLNITPDDVDTVALKASIAQAEGDLPRASAILGSIHPTADHTGALETQIYQAILERRPEQIISRLTEILARPDPAMGYFNGELRFWLGWAQQVGGDHAAAQESWRHAQSELKGFLQEQPENYNLMHDLALVEMGLGNKAAALAMAERAIATNPTEKDVVDGPASIEILARVAAQAGEPDRAVAALQKLLSIPYEGALPVGNSPLTAALLRFDPMFDPLRNDPRFQKLCEQKPN